MLALLSGGSGSVAPVPPVDPHFASVVLLTHIDAEPAVDVSNSGHTITTTGGSIQSTVKRFGARSFDAENATLGRLTVGDHNDWNVGSGEFTDELWARWAGAPGTVDGLLSQWTTAGNQRNRILRWSSTSIQFGYSTTGTDQTFLSTDTFNPVTDQWYHIAVDRDASDDLRIYIDGVVRHTTNLGSTSFNGSSTSALTIGNTPDDISSWNMNGFIDEVRLTNGVARYGGAFTPPFAPFPGS